LHQTQGTSQRPAKFTFVRRGPLPPQVTAKDIQPGYLTGNVPFRRSGASSLTLGPTDGFLDRLRASRASSIYAGQKERGQLAKTGP